MPPRRTLIIGRSKDADIVVEDETVSRFHAELVEAGDGRFYLTDRNSSSGTWRYEGTEWVKVRQCFVERDERLMFGKHEATLAGLLATSG